MKASKVQEVQRLSSRLFYTSSDYVYTYLLTYLNAYNPMLWRYVCTRFTIYREMSHICTIIIITIISIYAMSLSAHHLCVYLSICPYTIWYIMWYT